MLCQSEPLPIITASIPKIYRNYPKVILCTSSLSKKYTKQYVHALNIPMFWDVKRKLAEVYRRFREICSFHHQGRPPMIILDKYLTFFGPRTSIGDLSSTFCTEFRYVYRVFLSGRVSNLQRIQFVQNSTLLTNETGRNLPLKCRGV